VQSLSATAPAPAPPASLHELAPAPTTITGRFIDLFDPALGIVTNPQVAQGQRRLLLDPSFFPASKARVLAASGRITDEQTTAQELTFTITSIEGREDKDQAAVRLLLPRTASNITIDGKTITASTKNGNTTLLQFPAHATEQHIRVVF